MDVKTVCLGMLTDGAASGYDLKKQFESSFGHFFAAGYGSIYPALSALAENGMVTCEHIPQEGKPDRKVYAITGEGIAYLRSELENPAPSHKVRSEFLATMCFAHLMSDEHIETILDGRIDECDQFAEMIGEAQDRCRESWSPGMRFVAGFGEAVTAAMKRYVEDNRHLVVNHKEKKSATG